MSPSLRSGIPSEARDHRERELLRELGDEIGFTVRRDAVDELVRDRCEDRLDVAGHQARPERGGDERAVARVLGARHALQRSPHHRLAVQPVGRLGRERRFVAERALDVLVAGQQVRGTAVERHQRDGLVAPQPGQFLVEARDVERPVERAVEAGVARGVAGEVDGRPGPEIDLLLGPISRSPSRRSPSGEDRTARARGRAGPPRRLRRLPGAETRPRSPPPSGLGCLTGHAALAGADPPRGGGVPSVVPAPGATSTGRCPVRPDRGVRGRCAGADGGGGRRPARRTAPVPDLAGGCRGRRARRRERGCERVAVAGDDGVDGGRHRLAVAGTSGSRSCPRRCRRGRSRRSRSWSPRSASTSGSSEPTRFAFCVSDCARGTPAGIGCGVIFASRMLNVDVVVTCDDAMSTCPVVGPTGSMAKLASAAATVPSGTW